MKKSSWSEFLLAAKVGVQYVGSCFEVGPEEVLKKLEGATGGFSPDRRLLSGTTALKFAKPNGEATFLDRKGIVYKTDRYYLIHNKANNDNVVVYRHC